MAPFPNIVIHIEIKPSLIIPEVGDTPLHI